MEGAAATISDSAGLDFSTLPQDAFSMLKEVNDGDRRHQRVAGRYRYRIMQQMGEDRRITREEFFE